MYTHKNLVVGYSPTVTLLFLGFCVVVAKLSKCCMISLHHHCPPHVPLGYLAFILGASSVCFLCFHLFPFSRHHAELSPATAADARTDSLRPSGSRPAVGTGRRADHHAEHSSHHRARCPSDHDSSGGNHSQDLRAQRHCGDSPNGRALHKPRHCTDALRTRGIILKLFGSLCA